MDPITVVTGFPRGGSSLAMSLLESGGMDVYAENRSSYEHLDVNGLPQKTGWLRNCHGKAVKILDPLHFTPPQKLYGQWAAYRFIWLDRDHRQQSLSSACMMRTFAGLSINPRKLQKSYAADRAKSLALLQSYRASALLILKFEDLILDQETTLRKLALFTKTNASQMGGVIIPRPIECQNFRIELEKLENERLTRKCAG